MINTNSEICMSKKAYFFINLLHLVLFISLTSSNYNTQELPQFELTIQNHHFQPADLSLPANTKLVLVIHNKDNSAEEFECPDLRKEKIIPANSTVKMVFQPMESGKYEFFGEFNPDHAKGQLIVE